MPRMPASWNASTRLAAKHALVALVVVGLFLAFLNAKDLAISGLLAPLLGLVAAYLLLVSVPLTLGRALKAMTRLPSALLVLIYLSWGGVLAWTLAGNSFDVLARCVVSLPRYLDLHGYFTVSTILVGGAAYLIVRKTLVRVEDAFSLAPSAALGLMMALDGFLYRKGLVGDSLDLLTAETYHGATSFVAAFVAVTFGCYVAGMLRQ